MLNPFKNNLLIHSFEKMINFLFRKAGIKLKLSDLLRIALVKVVQSENLGININKKNNEKNESEYLPPALELSIYRDLNSDLANLNDDELKEHYDRIGCREGRMCSSVRSRENFVSLICNIKGKKLEIGPYMSPLLKKDSETYFSDYFSTEELRQEAVKDKKDPSRVTIIDFPTRGKSLQIAVGDNRFSAVISCHNIEHYPCMITHFQEVNSILENDGYYFMIVPDKRYTADYYQELSMIPEVLAAYAEKRKTTNIENTLKGVEFVTHPYPQRHWLNDHGDNPYLIIRKTVLNSLEKVAQYVQQHRYSDQHCWRFTPNSFSEILNSLYAVGLIKFKIIRIYPTLFGSNEFYVVLQKIK